jgi:DNA-binding MarR family transcriptional regulator
VTVTSARGTITLLSRLSKSVYRRTPESLLGMSLRHYLALSYVADPGGISQQQLSEILCIDANNTVLLLNEMEGQGLIRRVRDPADRRRHLVTLTPAGEKQLASASRAQKDTEDALFASLDNKQRKQLRGLLLALSDGLAANPDTACSTPEVTR